MKVQPGATFAVFSALALGCAQTDHDNGSLVDYIACAADEATSEVSPVVAEEGVEYMFPDTNASSRLAQSFTLEEGGQYWGVRMRFVGGQPETTPPSPVIRVVENTFDDALNSDRPSYDELIKETLDWRADVPTSLSWVTRRFRSSLRLEAGVTYWLTFGSEALHATAEEESRLGWSHSPGTGMMKYDWLNAQWASFVAADASGEDVTRQANFQLVGCDK